MAFTLMLLALLLGIPGLGQHTAHKVPVVSALRAFPDRKLMREIMDARGALDPQAAAKYYDRSY